MAAMKAMKAMKKKPISAKLARRHLFAGKITKTKSGYTKADFVKNKSGKVQQEGKPSCQEVTMDCCSPGGPQRTQDQGFLSHQEGHSTLQEGQGALRQVNTLSLRTK